MSKLYNYLGDVVGLALTLTVASFMPSPLPIAIVLAVGGLTTGMVCNYYRDKEKYRR